jgi:hypothetical protein
MFHHSYPLDLHRFCFWTIIGCVVSPALQSGCYQRKGGMVMYHMKYGLTPVTDAITKSKESNYLKESRASRQFWLNGGDSHKNVTILRGKPTILRRGQQNCDRPVAP